MHHPNSNINNSGSKSRYGATSTSTSGVHSSVHTGGSASKTPVTKNRQMKAFNSILSGDVRTYGGVNVLTNTSSGGRGVGSGSICIDDDMAQTIRNRKRRIVQSDDEEAEGGNEESGNVVVKGSGGGWSKRRRAGSIGKLCTCFCVCIWVVRLHCDMM